MRLALIGFMGAGKTTVSKLLAKKIGWTAIELDEQIVAASTYQSISEMIKVEGESYFRDQESACLRQLEGLDRIVISTGGGLIGRPENLASLRARPTKIIFLRANFEELARRVAGDDTRPLFQDKEKAAELYSKRQSLYSSAADLIIDSDALKPEDIAELIYQKVQSDVEFSS